MDRLVTAHTLVSLSVVSFFLQSQESAQSLQEVQFRQREMESQLLNSQQTVLSKTEELDKELQSSRRYGPPKHICTC